MNTRPIRILLVEDNLVEARLLQELLSDAKVTRFDITRAGRLDEAIDTARRGDFDIILLDLSLPDASGIETFRRLHAAVENLPIVVLTGMEDETIALTALQEGAQDYLTKQFSDGSSIERAIRYAMQRKQAETERLQLIRDQAEKTKQLHIEQAARREAEKANELKMQFLAMVSHELRTPLSSIKGFVSTLLADDVEWDAESQRNFLHIVEQETDKLTDLVEQILDLARLQAGTLRIEMKEQPLDEIFALASAQLGVITAEHRLDLHADDRLPLVMADPLRIAQVLVNLVGNAVRYSPPGTTIQVRAVPEGDHVRIDVRDEGHGIPIEVRPFVFEAFRQGLETGSSRKGAGLGLAICKGIIDNHGGQIWIDEDATPGTTVSFTLPAASVAQQQPA
jgi:signal transduction histidine kinase